MARTKHIDLESKICNSCEIEKPATTEFFSPHKGSLNSNCKPCAAVKTNFYRSQKKINNPEEYRAMCRKWHLKRRYGMTQEDYDVLLVKQDGVCAICNSNPQLSDKDLRYYELMVDHDSKTGKVRGLLCDLCNRSLGMMDDNPERLISAAAYLQRSITNG